jgi:hypothetical protein
MCEYVWLDNRDERFAAGINALVDGLESAQYPTPPQADPIPHGPLGHR